MFLKQHKAGGGPPKPAPQGRIKFNLARVAQARGIVTRRGSGRGRANLQAMARGTGLAYVTLYRMLRTPGKVEAITLESLARLCQYLDCQPGDIMEYVVAAPVPAPDMSQEYIQEEKQWSPDTRPIQTGLPIAWPSSVSIQPWPGSQFESPSNE